MARIVTRVTSKNFCIVKPSFELEQVTDLEGKPMLKVSKGQACINGMDLIIDQNNRIYPPDEAGTYYIALHLWRDSSSNVLGDLTVGVTKQFKGVYLDWWNEKDENDVDALWLGKVVWDGTAFTDIEEDLDKYGRIWAHDILCKMEDWKHPETTRIILQDWLYKVPDWYVSKEGDVIFGPLEFLAGRDPNVEGTSADHQDLGSGAYGVRLEAIDDNTTNIKIKAPSVTELDTNRVININQSNTGLRASIGPATINSVSSTGYNFVFNTPNKLNVSSDDEVIITGGSGNSYSRIDMIGNAIKFSNANSSVGEVDLTFNNNNISLSIGPNGTISYDTSDVFSIVNTAGPVNITSESGSGNVNVYANEFHVEGDVTAQRVWNAVYNGFGEIFRKDKTETIEFGDLVCIKADGLVHKVNSEEDIKTIIGICSDTVGIGLGGNDIPEDEKIEVEMVGQVWVKTNKELEAGKIVKALKDGTVDYTDNIQEKIGVTLTNTINGKVRIVFNG